MKRISLLLLLLGCADPAPEVQPVRAAPLRVMTFNVLWDGVPVHCPGDPNPPWPERKPVAQRLLQKYKPDVVALQEASSRQTTDLLAALPRMDAWRDDEEDKGAGGNTILYDRERFKRLDAGAFAVGGPWRCLWIRLEETATGRRFEVYNGHWDNGEPKIRLGSARTLLAFLKSRLDPVAALVVGDLNGPRNEGPIATLESDPELPLADVLSPDPDDVRWFQAEHHWGRVDYILVSPEWKVEEGSVLRDHEGAIFPSDHRPILATLE